MKQMLLFLAVSLLLTFSQNVYAQDTYEIVKIYNADFIKIGGVNKKEGDKFKDTDHIAFASDKVMFKASKKGTSHDYCFNKALMEAKKAKTLKSYFANDYAKVKGSAKGATNGNCPSLTPGRGNASKFPEKRIALIIGNGNYLDTNINALPNALNDARDVSKKLIQLGFDVMTLYDADIHDMNTSISSFFEKANSYEIALIYFSGHGVRYNGNDYLLSVDRGKMRITDECSLDYLVDLSESWKNANKKMIVVIDACRDRLGFNEDNKNISPKNGTIILQSTLSGEIALDADSEGSISPFAASFIECIGSPGIEIEDEFLSVKKKVANRTDGRQSPYINSGGIYGFCFSKGQAEKQTNPNGKSNYSVFREKGLKAFGEKQYAVAADMFDEAKRLNNTEEINRDIKALNDSIDSTYNKAVRLCEKTGKQYKEQALDMLLFLRNTKKESMAHIAWCYESLGNFTRAQNSYEEGTRKKQPLAVFWYALFLKKNYSYTSTQKRISLYKMVAPLYIEANDSLGVEYERLRKIDSAYFWYSKSPSDFSKYNRASLLLNPKNKSTLGNIKEDPYQLLIDVSDRNPEAAYYLGMLYRNQSRDKNDPINKKGWDYIKKAADRGHQKAQSAYRQKDEYIK